MWTLPSKSLRDDRLFPPLQVFALKHTGALVPCIWQKRFPSPLLHDLGRTLAEGRVSQCTGLGEARVLGQLRT